MIYKKLILIIVSLNYLSLQASQDLTFNFQEARHDFHSFLHEVDICELVSKNIIEESFKAGQDGYAPHLKIKILKLSLDKLYESMEEINKADNINTRINEKTIQTAYLLSTLQYTASTFQEYKERKKEFEKLEHHKDFKVIIINFEDNPTPHDIPIFCLLCKNAFSCCFPKKRKKIFLKNEELVTKEVTIDEQILSHQTEVHRRLSELESVKTPGDQILNSLKAPSQSQDMIEQII